MMLDLVRRKRSLSPVTETEYFIQSKKTKVLHENRAPLSEICNVKEATSETSTKSVTSQKAGDSPVIPADSRSRDLTYNYSDRRRKHRHCRSRQRHHDSDSGRRTALSWTHRHSEQLLEDDENGHLVFNEGDLLQERYELGRCIGEGTFGKVVLSYDLHNDRRKVAIKIVRKIPHYYKAAKMEVTVLERLQKADPDNESLCIEMLDWFDYNQHICIVFDLLGHSVYEFMKRNNGRAYPLSQVQRIGFQLCQAVKFCHDQGLTHTDLKPENILFKTSDFEVRHQSRGTSYRVLKQSDIRLIDFGSATFEDEHHSRMIGTRHFRAPEVVLELGWSYPSDVWSVGCILYELYTGRTLFQTHDNQEHLAIMEQLLGPLPREMINKTKKTHYIRHGELRWNERNRSGRYVRQHYKELQRYSEGRSGLHHDLFDLITKMLQYEPEKRITMSEALQHPFFTELL